MHLYISESYFVCAVSLTHSLRLCKPHLARHKYIISRRLHNAIKIRILLKRLKKMDDASPLPSTIENWS